MRKSDRIILSMAAALVLVTGFISFKQFYQECMAVRQESLRLHIIASSDSEDDQRLKLTVRDEILKEYGELLGRCGSSQQAAEVVNLLSNEIEKTAKKALLREGNDSDVKISLTDMYFDTKTYEEGVTLPAGEYKALRVIIGAGAGKNWWCVMYPPLCIPAATQKDAQEIEERIRSLSEYPSYQARFATVELLEKLKQKIFVTPEKEPIINVDEEQDLGSDS